MITISKNKLSHAIPDHIFAHNLEHTRACVYGGLSAQIFKNRKFAGKCGGTGVAYDWEGIGDKENYFYLCAADAYTRHADNETERHFLEKNSQKFQNIAGGKCGIRQTRVAMKANAEYEFKAVLKSGRDTRVSIRFESNEPEGTRTACESAFDVRSPEWETYNFNFKCGSTNENYVFELYTEEVGEVAVGAVSLTPADNFHGMRPDVIRDMKRIGVTMLRWPGGNFAGEYRWRDGLLEPDARAPLRSYLTIETQPCMYGFDNHEIGIDEFAALCAELGAEPFITLNLFWNTEKDSRDLLEYCNGGADTEYGALRASRGHTRPYCVKYWSLGNEMGYGHMEGLNTAEGYTEKALSTAIEMKKADPGVILCCSGPYPDGEWVAKSLTALRGVCDFAAYHSYIPLTLPYDLDFTSADGRRRSFELLTSAPYTTMREIHKFRKSIDAALGENKMMISFDEWNAWFAWFRVPSPGEGSFAGIMLNNACRFSRAFDMPLCCYFQPVNEGAIDVGCFESELTNIGLIFELFKRHRGGTAIETSGFDARDATTAEAIEIIERQDAAADDAAEAINNIEQQDADIFASYNAETGEIVITCVNKTSRDIDLEFRFEGFGEINSVVLRELAADDIAPGNRLAPRDFTANIKNVTLKKYSILRAVARVS